MPAAAAPAAIDGADQRRKAFEHARAVLALAGGFSLHELADGSLLVSRWDLCRPCADLQGVRRFLVQLGVRG